MKIGVDGFPILKRPKRPKRDEAALERALSSAMVRSYLPCPAPERFEGCARVYVEFSGKLTVKDRRIIERSTGKRFMPSPNCPSKAIYWGYDNATGREYAQASAFAAALNNAKVHLDAYSEAYMD